MAGSAKLSYGGFINASEVQKMTRGSVGKPARHRGKGCANLICACNFGAQKAVRVCPPCAAGPSRCAVRGEGIAAHSKRFQKSFVRTRAHRDFDIELGSV